MKGITRLWVVVLLMLPLLAHAAAKKERPISPASAAKMLTALSESKPFYAKSKTYAAGNVVVLQADPEILTVSNPFDLQSKAIGFTPVLGNEYVFGLEGNGFDGSVSQTLTLDDDDSSQVSLPFNFPFAGGVYNSCFVNSNGDITFEQPDPDPPNADTLLNGPPRIAAFFTDLDPSMDGTVFVHSTSSTVTISWLKVPEFFNSQQNQFDYGENTFQIVLHNDGRIDLIYSNDITGREALVGVIAGKGRSTLHSFDFSKGPLKNRAYSSLIENFRDYESIDIAKLMQSFYKSNKDQYDFVTIFSNFDLQPIPGAQAFALVVQNDVTGIGNPAQSGSAIFKDNKKYGSSGKLQNVTFFGNVHQYPSDPRKPAADTQLSLLGMLAHEVAHRWLAYVKLERDGKPSSVLLGRDNVHWSFFYDSNGSYLEGNDISQKSSNSFVTGAPYQRYSDLDLYLMGLISPSDVKDSFYVDGASHFSPNFPFANVSTPEQGVSFNGTAFPVQIGDIIAANGARKPDVSTSQKQFRHLFILVVKKDAPASPDEISTVDTLRQQWEGYFQSATGGRAQINTGN